MFQNIPSGYIQYHKDMPYVPEKVLEYGFNGKPLLYIHRKSPNFKKLVTIAIKTAHIREQINQIDLKLDN